jgi:hypothetical protein
MAFKFVENTIPSTPTNGANMSEGGSERKRSYMSSPSLAKPKPKPILMFALDDTNENEKETSCFDTIDAASLPQTLTASTLNYN